MITTAGTTASPSASSSQELASQIASCALDHYQTQLTKKAKPKSGKEWTVFAAIVAFHRFENRMWVVSSATGTKCTAQRHNELVLHDSHAEVLARRGFLRVLWLEITKKNSGNLIETQNDFEKKNSCSHDLLIDNPNCVGESFDNENSGSKLEGERYQLNPNIEIHFYISDSPCGDASIYGIPFASSVGGLEKSGNNNEILYTGAKVIISKATKVQAKDCGGEHQLLHINNVASAQRNEGQKSIGKTTAADPVIAREEVQALGKLRTKSGRSNLPAHMRSRSHSCSDKIVVWSVLGLQGAMLTKYLDPPVVPLTSIVVSIDSRLLEADDVSDSKLAIQHYQQQIALERAIPDRVRNVWGSLSKEQHGNLPAWIPPVPTVSIVRRIFESGKAAMIVASESKQFSGKKRKRFDDSEESNCNSENIDKGDCGRRNNQIKIKKAPPCGMAFNWNQQEGIEVLVGARGIKHGKKPKRPEDFEKLASRLCRAKLIQDFSPEKELHYGSANSQNAASCPLGLNGGMYHKIKESSARSEWRDLKNRVLTQNGSPLAGWLRCIEAGGSFSSNGSDEEKNQSQITIEKHQ